MVIVVTDCGGNMKGSRLKDVLDTDIPYGNKDLLYVVDYHIKAQMKIGAIKMFRGFTHTGLKEAKDFVDARQTQLKIDGVLDYE